MSFITGSPKDTWQPVMTDNTTLSSYWLNWRFFLCATWVLVLTTAASILIWKNECRRKVERYSGEIKQEAEPSLYDDETWRPCLKGIHPAWLLVFRLFAFSVLSVLLAIAVMVDGGTIFYYYTQWTFTSVTIYFALGSLLSMRGCYQYHKRLGGDKVDNVEADAEQGCCVTSAPGKGSMAMESSNPHEILDARQPAGKWAFIFQIFFRVISQRDYTFLTFIFGIGKFSQEPDETREGSKSSGYKYCSPMILCRFPFTFMNAGAVMLTDFVFWFVLVPFLEIKDYHLNALIISMHSFNAVFLLGDTALNSLRFPWFRVAYFFIWTVVYVLFQWIVHATFRLWWPYPFLDLSSPYAPLWYLSVAVMHIPCYGIFAFILKLKHTVFKRWYPDSYQCFR